jgi:hypothetical protein
MLVRVARDFNHYPDGCGRATAVILLCASWIGFYPERITVRVDIYSVNFIQFIWGERRNRVYLWSAVSVSCVLLALFKFFYPYPNLVLDSYFYLKAAAANWDVNAWPIGYSKFLRLFGWFTHSPLVLVCWQYLFLEFCNALFFFTLLYFYRPGKVAANCLFVFLFLNPLWLYLSNLIMADALFTGLTIVWVVQLLWIIFRPRPYMIVTHAILLLVTFTIRYNALFYPLIGSLAFLLSRQRLWMKLAGIGLQIALIGCFVLYTNNRYEVLTGTRQFSPFGGWKIANDALFAYAHVHPAKGDSVPIKFRALDRMVRRYFDYTHDPGDLNRRDVFWGSSYMFNGYSPLMQYMARQGKTDSGSGGFGFINSRPWAGVAPLYSAYGSWLMRKYPAAYIQYFVWPNAMQYIAPKLEIFEARTPFYLRPDDLGIAGRQWFGLTTLSVPPAYIDLRTQIISLYPIGGTLLQVCWVMGLVGFFWLRGWRKVSRAYLYTLLLVAALWLANLGFSIFAAVVVFRYLAFIFILLFGFTAVLIDLIYRLEEAPLSKNIIDNEVLASV